MTVQPAGTPSSVDGVAPGWEVHAGLSVQGLSVGYAGREGSVTHVVRDVSFVLEPGQILGLAGESGCGKSTVALTSIGYPAPGVRVLGGRSMLGGENLLASPLNALRDIWGSRIAYVAQSATAALNPVLSIERQMAEPLRRHQGLRGPALRERQLDLLDKVGIPDPPSALVRYPFQFSGGQQQRIAIAIALSCRPSVVVLDEPTTGLDVTTQARISALLKRVVCETNLAALYVSHDLALLNEVADRVVIMYGGEMVEEGEAGSVLRRARHPYTKALVRAAPDTARPGVIEGILGRPPGAVVTDACAFAPRCEFAIDRCTTDPVELRPIGDRLVRCLRAEEIVDQHTSGHELPHAAAGETLLDVRGLVCTYRSAAAPVVRDVSFTVGAGETVGIVGESGSGKSTLLRAIAGLHAPAGGTIFYRGTAVAARAVKRPRSLLDEIQLIFQNPDSSLNPRHTVESLVSRPLQLFRPDVARRDRSAAVAELLASVKLPADLMRRYPPELSGGQKQRVAIACAFAARPSLLLCDEVTSALDVSVQATVLELLSDLSAATGTAVVFVSHDLAVVRAVSTKTVVMRNGEICETGRTVDVFKRPQHQYTQELLAAIPNLPV